MGHCSGGLVSHRPAGRHSGAAQPPAERGAIKAGNHAASAAGPDPSLALPGVFGRACVPGRGRRRDAARGGAAGAALRGDQHPRAAPAAHRPAAAVVGRLRTGRFEAAVIQPHASAASGGSKHSGCFFDSAGSIADIVLVSNRSGCWRANATARPAHSQRASARLADPGRGQASRPINSSPVRLLPARQDLMVVEPYIHAVCTIGLCKREWTDLVC